MESAVFQEQIEAARAYENLFVASLFGPWAPVVVDAAGIRRNERVLDIACGTGVLARTAAERALPGGAVTGLDPNPGMLAVAAELNSDIDWKLGTAESLPFEDASFDAVISQFGLMFFTERIKAIEEMLRVMAPGGRVAVAVWDSLQNTPAYADDVAMLERIACRAAADALRAPFVLGDEKLLANLFNEAGASEVKVLRKYGLADFPALKVMVEADLRGWLPVMGVTLSEDVIAAVLEEAEQVLGRYVTEGGRVRFDSPALVVTARKS